MWKTLYAQYKDSGTILEYNTIQEFIIDFQKAIQKLKDLPDIAPPNK
jgi:hypothetical protein